MEIIALCAPWVLLTICIAGVGLLAFKKWKWTVGLFVLAVVGNWHFECFHINLPWYDIDSIQTLRVLSFNCNLSTKHEDNTSKRAGVIKLILEQEPDIIFLTENFIHKQDSVWLELQRVYPYRTQRNNVVGNSIYSKYPIISDTLYTSEDYPYGISYCQIRYKSSSINILGCHLSSNNYNEHHEYMTPDSVENSQESKAYLRNVIDASGYRETECNELLSVLNGTGDPTIVMGDMNDVAGSPAMRVLKKAHLKDAWWQKGFGYGATIHKPLPYRIDHIMYRDAVVSNGSNQFQKVPGSLRLKSIRKIDSNDLSDHNALVAEFSMIK